MKFNTALAITAAIWGTLRGKVYKELGIETLNSKRWLENGVLSANLKKTNSILFSRANHLRIQLMKHAE